MRLALAIASFVILVVHGIVFYNQFFHKWENYQTAYFDQARSLAKTDAERSALDARTPRIEQTIVTQFGDTRVDRCATCHIAADDPRFQGHAQPLRTHSYSAALGDTFRNGKWERRHKFADFGCTVCHDGQGRGLKEVYSHGQDEFWNEPLIGYVTQADWKKEFRPHLTDKEYMQARARRWSPGAGSSSTRRTATAATKSRASPRARWRRISPKPAGSSSSTTSGSRSSIPPRISRPRSCRSSACRTTT